MDTSSPVDRGPATVDDDPPRSPRGMWRLLGIPDVGATRAMNLATHHYTWATLHRAAIDGTLARLVGMKVATWIRDHGVPERELPSTTDAAVLTPWSDGYPRRLRDTPGCPTLIWVRGQLPRAGKALTVVGARDPSAFGTAVATRASRTAATEGITTVSGLAPGIDTTCAEETLAAGGTHLAVLGAGIDQPRQPALADAIVAGGGALISEQPPGTGRTGRTLVARNRIQTALGDATLVAAAAVRSGTAHTARFALVQARPLWAPRPTEAYADHPSSGLLQALCRPDGLADPADIHASGRLGEQLANRRPCADVIIHDGDQLDRLVAVL